MPSSLVFTALVVSWLAVLVPVVARRRQLVPRPAEADLCSRVLSRSGRASTVKEVVVSHQVSEGRGRSDGAGATALADRDEPVVAPPGGARALGAVPAATGGGERDEPLPVPTGARPLGADVDRDREDRDLDDGFEDDGFEDEHDADPDDRDMDEPDGPHREPKPYRPGRGGFDADAAREAADARYATRRRTALALIAVAVLSGLAALVVTSAAWWVCAATVVGLAGYLVFLRRQTRLEEELRERRIARLHGQRRAVEARRERQAEHRARLDALDEDWADDGGDDVDDVDHRDRRDQDDDWDDEPRVSAVAEPRWAAPRSPAPAVPYGMELVADSDDDPAFHDLAADRVPAYRRAAGA